MSCFHRFDGSDDRDQLCHFTSIEFTKRRLAPGLKLPVNGWGRTLDNVFIERLWRSVKYEEVDLKSYCSQIEAYTQLEAFFWFYNERRPHSAFGNEHPRMPLEVYREPIRLAINQ